jgi:hypothetical protein
LQQLAIERQGRATEARTTEGRLLARQWWQPERRRCADARSGLTGTRTARNLFGFFFRELDRFGHGWSLLDKYRVISGSISQRVTTGLSPRCVTVYPVRSLGFETWRWSAVLPHELSPIGDTAVT